MLINEAAALCNLTKKAIEYYLEQGLICPKVLENGYRDFSEQDAARLKEIGLYRKLGLSIAEIRCVLADPGETRQVLYKRTLELEREKVRQGILARLSNGERLADLEQEINSISAQSAIVKRLMDMFPGYYGKYISVNFARYLTVEIKTAEQMQALKEVIDFLDNVPAFEIPEELREYLDRYLAEYSGEAGLAKIEQLIRGKEEAIENIDDFMQKNHEFIKRYSEYRQTAEFANSPAGKLMALMKQFCASSGYYERFIPAMRRLSPLYNEYYEQMLRANERFAEHYPEYGK